MNDFIRSLHSEFSEDAVPSQREGYHMEKIPCCFLLRNPDQKHTLKLNSASVLIWNLCNGAFTVREILKLLTDNYPEAAPTIKRDVFRVLDEFVAENVIVLR